MANQTFSSASGLRPASAFVVIGIVIVAVAIQIAWVSYWRDGSQPARVEEETRKQPEYSISDSRGQVLARFLPSVCLNMSPRSMWQAHTPELMAEEISKVLDRWVDSDTLLALFFPDADDLGVIEVDGWNISPRQAERINEWIISGAGSKKGHLEGIWIERLPIRDAGERLYQERLFWRPKALLSKAHRELHGSRSAWRWARRLADGLTCCILEPEEASLYMEYEPKEKDVVRAGLWADLCPSADTTPLRGIPPDKLVALRNVLADQGVLPWQMDIVYDRKRVYPAGRARLFGCWGYVEHDATERTPRGGLERLCDEMLAAKRWPVPESTPEVYTWRKDRTVRGRRSNSFVSYEPASSVPVIVTTLDLSLQAFVKEALAEVIATHEPALAMALVADVATGDVLAVESLDAYGVQYFVPLYHQFTVGSTFKLVTMAVALEEGVVDPTDPIDVGQGAFRVNNSEGRPTRRVIREAEGARTGIIPAAECVAFSNNAGMAKIGLLVDDERFHAYMKRLGYGEKPGTGLGSERGGSMPKLPWKRQYTHASIGFGHELSSTLWQHATSLISILRGGLYRPLRIVRGLELDQERYECSLEPGERVFSEDTANKVRQMMRLGSQIGTGDDLRPLFEKHLAAWAGRDIDGLDFDFGTKTGTAQKVPTEVCLHVELGLQQGTSTGVEKPHKSCYTSSICVFGSRPGDDRELMVLVVVDEPRGEKRFGAQVAGPAAEKILSEALGLTKSGEAPDSQGALGFGTSELAFSNKKFQPWRVVEREEWASEGETIQGDSPW